MQGSRLDNLNWTDLLSFLAAVRCLSAFCQLIYSFGGTNSGLFEFASTPDCCSECVHSTFADIYRMKFMEDSMDTFIALSIDLHFGTVSKVFSHGFHGCELTLHFLLVVVSISQTMMVMIGSCILQLLHIWLKLKRDFHCFLFL